MNTEFRNTIILVTSFLVLFGLAELLYHKFKVKAEFTRKLVHVGTGLLTMLFPLMLNNHWLVLLLCSSFAVILISSLRFDFLKSINAIDRDSVGSIAYPVSVYVCYLVMELNGSYFHHYYRYYPFFYLPILTLAFCDPLAALIGKQWPFGKYKIGSGHKTIAGSSTFFVSALVLALALQQSLFTSIIIALIATIAEAISPRGFDNLTIPASVLIVLYLLQANLQ